MSVLRTNVEFAKRILADRVGNRYVYGGNWNPFNLKVGTDCSGLVVDILDATVNGTAMAWTRHGMSTESWRPIDVGQVGPFGTICVKSPADFPANAAVKIAIHHGPGGGANSHTWCEVDGVRGESNGTDGCVTGSRARDVNDTSYANDWHYLPGPISGSAPSGPPDLSKKDQYAVQVIQEGQRRGITPRGIQIALATVLVESGWTMYANARVPASMNIPHEAVGSDAYSVGLFQQQVRDTGNGWWWGDARTCMDPTLSAGLFYDRLSRLDYNGSNSPGSYAQAVQSSAYPDRYDERFVEAVEIYNRLSNQTGDDDMFTDEDREMLRQIAVIRRKSLSPFRWPFEAEVNTCAGFAWTADANIHIQLVEKLAVIYGDPQSIGMLLAVSRTNEPGREADSALALRVLNRVTPAGKVSGEAWLAKNNVKVTA